MGKKLTTHEFIERAKKIHGGRYDYSKVNYINNRTKVNIICKLHGEFSQSTYSHVIGQGCPICSIEYVTKSCTKTQEQYIEKVNIVHNNKYDYTKTKYIHNKEKITITCKEHGDFTQMAYQHTDGQGCPKCGNESHWKRSDYIKKAKGRLCTFYVIECFNESEGFYKIGITVKSVKGRYSSTEKMPYNYQIVSEIHGEAGLIWDLEKEEKRKLKEFHYKPKIGFKGSITECFTKYKN